MCYTIFVLLLFIVFPNWRNESNAAGYIRLIIKWGNASYLLGWNKRWINNFRDSFIVLKMYTIMMKISELMILNNLVWCVGCLLFRSFNFSSYIQHQCTCTLNLKDVFVFQNRRRIIILWILLINIRYRRKYRMSEVK